MPENLTRLGRIDSDHDAVGSHEIRDGMSLLQEFRIRADGKGLTGLCRDRFTHSADVRIGAVLFVTTTA